MEMKEKFPKLEWNEKFGVTTLILLNCEFGIFRTWNRNIYNINEIYLRRCSHEMCS